MLLLSKEDMKEVFTMRDAVEAVKESFRLFSCREGRGAGARKYTCTGTWRIYDVYAVFCGGDGYGVPQGR